ncbi:MAG: hypothetical protein WCX61_00045 [Candidatus Peribacteraceae bacterium]
MSQINIHAGTIVYKVRRTALLVIIFFGILAIAKGMYDLWRVSSLIATGIVDADTPAYFIMGRGILNGLTPYVDLFESKPPGMFLLTALSLVVTRGPWLVTVLNIIVLVLLPILLTIYAVRQHRTEQSRIALFWLSGTAFLIGISLSLFLQRWTVAVQTEVFGAFFACLYLLHVAWTPSTAWRSTLLRAVLLAGAIGMKEPFVFATVAGTLLIVRDRKEFWRAFVLPLLLAIIIGLCSLVVLGFAKGYFTLYLPAMLQDRLSNDPFAPWYVRIFSVRKVIYNNMTAYDAWGFGLIMIVLWIFFPLWKERRSDLLGLFLIVCGSVTGYFFLHLTWKLLTFFQVAQQVNLDDFASFISLKIAQYFAFTSWLAFVLYLQHKRNFAAHTLIAMFALLPLCLIVEIGGMRDLYWAFTVPLYFALVLVFLRYAATEKFMVFGGILGVLAALTVLLYHPHWNQEYIHRQLLYGVNRNADVVRRFDGMLDDCGFERYAAMDAILKLAFATHSPIGPVFNPSDHKYLGEDHQLFQETFQNIADEARVIVVPTHAIPYWHYVSLVPAFYADPPDCAKPYLPLEDLNVYFR